MSRFAPVLALLLSTSCTAPAARERTQPGASNNASKADILAELNIVRTNPAAYAAKLEARRAFYHGKLFRPPNQIPIQTNEGVAALDDAIRALRSSTPRPPIAPSAALRDAALDHVRDIGPKGLVSHEGTDHSSPFDRVRRRDPHAAAVAEVMSFGSDAPASVIADLLIDDGVADRGHRRILLDAKYRFAGSACGPHKGYGVVCVIDLADVAK